MENKKIENFKDLKAWQEGHKLAILVYKITKNFPKEETYSLVDQMRRAVVSVTSNIAEGFGRHGYKEKANFYKMAQGSLAELENQMLLAKDVSYIDVSTFGNFEVQLKNAQKLLGGLITKTKSFFSPSSSNLKSLFSILIPISILYSLFSPHPVDAFTLSKSSNNLLGLVGHWTFDGKNMYQNVADTSGNGNNGSLKLGSTGNTSTTTSSGKIGQALVFDGGNDDYVIIPNTVLDGATNVTASFWLKTRNGISQSVISGANSGNNNEFLIFSSSNGTSFSFFPGVNAGGSASWSVGTIGDGQWHHWVITRDQDNSALNLYKDGVRDTEGPKATTTTALLIDSGGLLFGQEQDSVGGGFDATQSLDGTLDDVRIYNRVLSDSEIRQLYNQGVGIKVNVTPKDPLKSGLVGWWTFDGKDMPSGKATDGSGNGNSGSPLNISTSTFYTAGKIGQGLNFDGVDDSVSLPPTTTIGGKSSVTISSWVKSLTITTNIYSEQINGGTTPRVRMRVSASGTIICAARAPDSQANQEITSVSNLQLGQWTYVACIFDPANNSIMLYINGQLAATTGTVAFTQSTFDSTASNGIAIGSNAGAAGTFFSGIIDDVRIYSRALSADEILELYNQGAATKINVSPKNSLTSGLVGWWTFDGKDMPSGKATDGSGNGNSGSPMNISTSTFFTAGKIGQALNFDGVNDNVNVGDPSSIQFDIDDPFSVAFWVKAPLHNAANNYIFLSKTNNVHGLGWYIWSWSSTDFAYFTIGTASGGGGPNYTVNSSPSIITDNKWHYVTATYTGNSNQSGMTLYVDGVLVSTGSNSAISTSILNANKLTINGYDGTTYNTGVGPSIDDVRIYSRALSASEIKQLYNMGR